VLCPSLPPVRPSARSPLQHLTTLWRPGPRGAACKCVGSVRVTVTGVDGPGHDAGLDWDS
jgi:hypothetical protein